jgi:hypothetical protein
VDVARVGQRGTEAHDLLVLCGQPGHGFGPEHLEGGQLLVAIDNPLLQNVGPVLQASDLGLAWIGDDAGLAELLAAPARTLA